MAENEAKKVIKTETSKKDVDKKEASSKKNPRPKHPNCLPLCRSGQKMPFNMD